jgi:hypothetical protein
LTAETKLRGSSTPHNSAVEAVARKNLFAAAASTPTEHRPQTLSYTYLHVG